MSKSAGERLIELAKLYEERNRVYGDGYVRHGKVFEALFPDGLVQVNAKDGTRFNLLTCIIIKLVRYCDNFGVGGHADSLDDLAVYAQILRSYDDEVKLK